MLKAKVRPRIGLLPTGHKIYWGQFPNLKEMGMRMYEKLLARLEQFGDVASPGLVDTYEAAVDAAQLLSEGGVDILLIFPFGYTTGSPQTNASYARHLRCVSFQSPEAFSSNEIFLK